MNYCSLVPKFTFNVFYHQEFSQVCIYTQTGSYVSVGNVRPSERSQMVIPWDYFIENAIIYLANNWRISLHHWCKKWLCCKLTPQYNQCFKRYQQIQENQIPENQPQTHLHNYIWEFGIPTCWTWASLPWTLVHCMSLCSNSTYWTSGTLSFTSQHFIGIHSTKGNETIKTTDTQS